MISAGSLRHPVHAEAPATATGSYGDTRARTWNDITGVFWARVAPLTGREFFAAQQVSSNITTKVTFRERSDLAPNMRIIHGSRILSIKAILPPVHSGAPMVALCEESST